MIGSRRRSLGWFRLLWLALFAMWGLYGLGHNAIAQNSDEDWTAPVNLSHSGGSTNPSIVGSADGVIHVVWEDVYASSAYVRGEAGLWEPPVPVELPFRGLSYRLAAGKNDLIHALWIDDEGSLFYKGVRGAEFGNGASWEGASWLASSVLTFDVAVDDENQIHLVFVRGEDLQDFSSGIYYARSDASRENWSLEPVYLSRYFRSLTDTGEDDRSTIPASEPTHVDIETSQIDGTTPVYITWDIPALKRVFFTRSRDAGRSWDEPVEVDGPDLNAPYASPRQINISANGRSLLLLWQASESGGSCTQVYQSSNDGGDTWNGSGAVFKELGSCPEAIQNFAVPEGLTLFFATVQNQVYLLAWDGEQWSLPQGQLSLNNFLDQETYNLVEYGCRQAALVGGQLIVVGCDLGGGGDIRVTSRDVESTTSWFSPPVWSQPAPVTGDELEVAAVELVATGDDLIHAFFGQRQDPAIYYTRWDGATWSRITPVLQLPDGEAGWPAIAAGPGNELFLMARSSSGSLYFSRANSSDAVTASGWSTPTRLRIAHDGKVSSADVAWDAAGTVHIAYSVPVNDERGVYLVQSKDQGKTWSGPLQVFNGAAAGFDLVGSPSLLATVNGLMHIIWKQQSIPVDSVSQPLSLYYARSEDAGHTFSEAELVVEAPVAWREIVADGKGNLHRLWQRPDMMTTLWDQVSFDGGHSWRFAQRLPAEGGTAAVTVDTVGRLHLVGVGLGSLGHWLWDGSRWQAEAPLRWSLASQREGPVVLAAAVSMDGKMVVVLAVPTGAGDVAERLLLYATRTLDLPPKQTAIQETPTRSPPSPTHTPATPPLERSLTPAAKVDSGSARLQGPKDRINASDPMTQFAMALLPVALLLLTVLSIVALRARSGQGSVGKRAAKRPLLPTPEGVKVSATKSHDAPQGDSRPQ